MKTFLSLIGVAALLATVTVQAQLTTSKPMAPQRATASDKNWSSDILTFAQSVSDAKEITVALYPTYAPDIVVNGHKSQWGAGIAALYPVLPDSLGNHAYTGLRLDWVAEGFFAPSAEVGLKADVQILGHNFTPFIEGGLVYPLSARSTAPSQTDSIGAIAGAGVTANIWSSASGKAQANVFVVVEKWTNFPGQIYHLGAAFTFKF